MIATHGPDCPIPINRIHAAVCWVTLFLLLGFPLASLASVYRCPGTEGAVQFQQTPCENGQLLELQDNSTAWTAAPRAKATKQRGKVKKRSKKKTRLAGGRARQEKACWKARQRIEKIEWSLRKGYRPARGERLRQQRREQQAYLRQFCR